MSRKRGYHAPLAFSFDKVLMGIADEKRPPPKKRGRKKKGGDG